MRKVEFAEFLQDEIREEIPELENAQMWLRYIEKDNDRSYYGLTIKKQGMDISPTFNMDAMYKEYTETEDMLTIMDTIRAGFEELPSLDRMGIDLSDYDSVKNNITMVIREKSRCQDIINDVPYIQKGEFIGLFKMEFINDEAAMSATINNKIISPSYNFDSLYNEYERTGDMYTIISLIKSGFEHMPNLREMNIDLNDYDSIRDNITMVVRSKDRCMDIINDVPYVEQGEFIGLFKIEFQKNEHESYAAIISNATLEAYGITKDELYDQAKENDKKNTYKQPILCDINDIIFNIIAGEKLFDEKNLLENNEIINIEDDELLVLSNRGSREGAALLFNEDVLERISEVMNGDYYIIPSSIHEVIVLKEMPAPELNQMIAEVNNTQVEPEDVLSYNAQYYDSRNKTLVNALSHENQQKFREMTGEISHDSEMRHEEKARKNLYLKNKEQKERAK